MTGILILAVLALAIVAALEVSNRRHAATLGRRLDGSPTTGDRDLARSKLDLLALGGAAEPFAHKPAGRADSVVSIRSARIFSHHHGRHAA